MYRDSGGSRAQSPPMRVLCMTPAAAPYHSRQPEDEVTRALLTQRIAVSSSQMTELATLASR